MEEALSTVLLTQPLLEITSKPFRWHKTRILEMHLLPSYDLLVALFNLQYTDEVQTISATLPANLACTGTSGNARGICLVKCTQSAGFGGCVPVQQTGTAAVNGNGNANVEPNNGNNGNNDNGNNGNNNNNNGNNGNGNRRNRNGANRANANRFRNNQNQRQRARQRRSAAPSTYILVERDANLAPKVTLSKKRSVSSDNSVARRKRRSVRFLKRRQNGNNT